MSDLPSQYCSCGQLKSPSEEYCPKCKALKEPAQEEGNTFFKEYLEQGDEE